MGRGRITIYLVDEDASVRRSLARLVRSAGYSPAVFGNAEELFECEEFVAPACVLLSVDSPRDSDLRLPQRLRRRGVSMPIILLTADDGDALPSEARDRGFEALFRKPVDDQALIDAISWALGNRP